MIYRPFPGARDTNAGYRSNALDEKNAVEYIPSNGDKSPNRMTLKDIEIKPLQTVSFRLYFEKLFLRR